MIYCSPFLSVSLWRCMEEEVAFYLRRLLEEWLIEVKQWQQVKHSMRFVRLNGQLNSTFRCLTRVFASVHNPLSASATLTNFASLKNSFKSPFDITCSFKYSYNGAFKCLHFYSLSTLRFTVWSHHTKRTGNVFSAISNSTSHYFCLHVERSHPFSFISSPSFASFITAIQNKHHFCRVVLVLSITMFTLPCNQLVAEYSKNSVA